MHFDPVAFGAGLVEVSAPAAYAALRLARDDGVSQHELLQGLSRAASKRCNSDFVSLAQSGMADAVVPFHRMQEDILYVGACTTRGHRLRFAGMGNAVFAGFFELETSKCRYVDQVQPTHQPSTEILPETATAALCEQLSQWTDRPQVEVGDLAEGELLKLRSNVTGLRCLPTTPSVASRVMPGSMKPVISVIRVYQGEPDPQQKHPIRTETISQGNMVLDHEAGTWVLRNPQPELVMEMHAAWLNEPDPSSLWLLIRHYGEQILAPLPDLMQTGSVSRGWWMPTRDLHEEMGTPVDGTEVQIPRSTTLRLMQRFPWFLPLSPKESAVLAWWGRQYESDSLSTMNIA